MFNQFSWNAIPYGAFDGENKHHTYCLCVEGLGKIQTLYFGSRYAADAEMHNLMGRNRLHIIKQYDDKHDKTYICDNNVKFYITRW